MATRIERAQLGDADAVMQLVAQNRLPLDGLRGAVLRLRIVDAAAALLTSAQLDRVKAELAKCVLLCANCHRETHAGLRSSADAPRIGETAACYRIANTLAAA